MSYLKIGLGILGCVGMVYLLPRSIHAWKTLKNYLDNHYGGGLGEMVLYVDVLVHVVGLVLSAFLIYMCFLEIIKAANQ